jgi:hypothetical protein
MTPRSHEWAFSYLGRERATPTIPLAAHRFVSEWHSHPETPSVVPRDTVDVHAVHIHGVTDIDSEKYANPTICRERD